MITNPNYEPTRMCVACRKKTKKSELIRYVVKIKEDADFDNTKGQSTIRIEDVNKCLEGRGHYVCDDPICIDKMQNMKIRKTKLKTKQEKRKKVNNGR